VDLFEDLASVKDIPVNTDTLDGFENPDPERDSSAYDSTPGLPSVISFEDIFSQDEAHRSRLESIIGRGRRGRGVGVAAGRAASSFPVISDDQSAAPCRPSYD